MLENRRRIVHFFLPEPYAIGGLCGVLTAHPKMLMSRRSLNLYQMNHPRIAVLEKRLHRRMRHIVGNSKAVLSDLEQEGVAPSRLRLIYNGTEGANSESGGGLVRKDIGLGEDDVVAVMVATLIHYKGQADLIDALAELSARMPKLKVILVGRDDGMEGRLVARAVRLDIRDRIVFLGERHDVADVLALADIGVLCSHQEGFSNSLLESMVAGLPMVVTAVGGNVEAVLDGETGFVVPPHSPEALATALERLACDPELRAAMGAAGRQRVKERFSLDTCVRAYADLYEEVAREA